MNKCKSCMHLEEIHEYDAGVVCKKRGNTSVCSKCIDYLSKRQVKKLEKLKNKVEKLKVQTEEK